MIITSCGSHIIFIKIMVKLRWGNKYLIDSEVLLWVRHLVQKFPLVLLGRLLGIAGMGKFKSYPSQTTLRCFIIYSVLPFFV